LSQRNVISMKPQRGAPRVCEVLLKRTRGPVHAALLAFTVLAAHPRRALADGPIVAPEYTPPPATDTTTPAAVADEHATPASGGVTPRCVAFVAAGLAVVGVGVGTTFGVLALDSKNTFDAHPTVARADTGNQEAVLADVAFGTAVIAGVTSLVLFLKHAEPATQTPAAPASPPASVSFAVSPMVSPHGGGAGAVLRF
jgi:hypothetical protein